MLFFVGQLSKGLGTLVANVRPLPGVCSDVNFQIRQLTENLAADVAPILELAVLLFQLEREALGASAGVHPGGRGGRPRRL